MNKLIAHLILGCIFLTAQAQEKEFQTIGGNNGVRVSGFGGPLMNFATIKGDIDKDVAFFIGGGGGVMINNFFFGGYGMGLSNQVDYKATPQADNLTFNHGGFWFGYIAKPNWAVHPTLHVQTGWGSLKPRSKFNDIDYEFDNLVGFIDKVFVVSPTLELEMNFSRFFKLGAGVNYMFVYGTDGVIGKRPYTMSDFNMPIKGEMSAPNVFVSFKFGWF